MITFSTIVDRIVSLTQKSSLLVQTVDATNDSLRHYHGRYDLEKDFYDRTYYLDYNKKDILIDTTQCPRILQVTTCDNEVVVPYARNYTKGVNDYIHFWYQDMDGVHVVGVPECTVKHRFYPPFRKYYSAASNEFPPAKYEDGKWYYLSNNNYVQTLGDTNLEFVARMEVSDWIISQYPYLIELSVQTKIANYVQDPTAQTLYSQLKIEEGNFLNMEYNGR